MTGYLSDKIRVLSLTAMALLMYVHAYTFPSNLFTGEPLSAEGFSFSVQYFISQGVARFRVPMFFTLSGYFFFSSMQRARTGYRAQFTKRLRTIAVPYLLWSLIGLGIYAIVQLPSGTRGFFQHNLVWQFTPVEVIDKLLLDPIPYQLWFLRDLMVLFLLSPLIRPIVLRSGVWALVPPFIAWSSGMDLVIIQNESLPFFIAGAYLALNGKTDEVRLSPKVTAAVVFAWLLLLLIKTVMVLTNALDIRWVNALHRLSVVLGLAAMWTGYDLLVKYRGDVREHVYFPYTSFTFFLFAFHEPWLTLIKNTLFVLLGKGTWTTLAIYFLTPPLVMALAFTVGWSMKRRVPAVYDLLTGGR